MSSGEKFNFVQTYVDRETGLPTTTIVGWTTTTRPSVGPYKGRVFKTDTSVRVPADVFDAAVKAYRAPLFHTRLAGTEVAAIVAALEEYAKARPKLLAPIYRALIDRLTVEWADWLEAGKAKPKHEVKVKAKKRR